MRYLLDVNVLIALLDSSHRHHDPAKRWFRAHGSAAWATCPIVQNGAIRILGGAGYPSGPGSSAVVATSLREWCTVPNHEFWPDDISMLDGDAVDLSMVKSAKHTTDIYLLALAASKGGRLATFDTRFAADAVSHGAQSLHLIDLEAADVPPFH